MREEMKTITDSQPITFETALEIVNAAVFSQASRRLKNIEVEVLQGAWLGKTYDQIALESGYAPEYIKHDVGPKLWQILSASFGEKVSKTSLIAVLASKAKTGPISTSTSSPTLGINAPLTQLKSLEGPISLDSNFYVERPLVEAHCYTEITKPGSLIRIKAPAQMGKTSLMVRILAVAKQAQLEISEVSTVALSLQRADSSVFQDLDRFLRWFCAAITRKLQLPSQVSEYWSDTFGSKSNCTAYFEDCILSNLEGKLVLALDQVDEVFKHPEIADDFFSLLRSWYEEAAYGESGNPLWQKLCLMIAHSTEVYIPLDINKSPFNVGLAVELQPFTPVQVAELAERYQVKLTEAEYNVLMKLVAGHPYLVQRALFHLSQGLDFTQFVQTAATDAGIYHHHLHQHLSRLQAHPYLAVAYEQVTQSATPVELEQLIAFKLQSLGLVKIQGNQVISSCQLYQRYFCTGIANR
jgi:hypothetical protein